MSMMYLAAAIAIWGAIHSLLASVPVKEFLRRSLGAGPIRFYRLAYNIFSVFTFLPVVYLMLVLPDRPVYTVPAPWSWLMLAGQALAALFLVTGVLQTDPLAFVGLRQFLEEEKPGRLVTRGLYRYVRHPLYTFGLLFIWLSPDMTVNSLMVYAAATIYTVIGAFFEERKLLREFGRPYAQYQQDTPMLIPGLILHRNK